MNAAALIALLVPGLVLMVVVASLIRGWVLSVMWGWFVVPVFGLPSLSLPAAIGLAMIASFLTYQHDAKTKSEGNLTASLLMLFVAPLVGLGAAWIVKGFM